MPASTSPANLAAVDAITAAAFPTPALAQRTNDPATLAKIGGFAEHQAAIAKDLAATVARRLHDVPGDAERMVAATLEAARNWRYRLAVGTGEVRRGTGIPLDHDRYRTPITDHTTNYDRIGYVGRARDGAQWDPAFRLYRGGTATPAFHTLVEAGRRALERFETDAPNGAVLQNFVELPDGTLVLGNRLLRGQAAEDVAKELTERLAARGSDRVETGGVLLYTATATEADRTRLHQAAVDAFAEAITTTDQVAALRSWVHGAYCLYQAPWTKKGSDAVARVALVAFGTLALGRVPQLPQDIDLRGYVDGQDAFTHDLQALQG